MPRASRTGRRAGAYTRTLRKVCCPYGGTVLPLKGEERQARLVDNDALRNLERLPIYRALAPLSVDVHTDKGLICEGCVGAHADERTLVPALERLGES